MWKYITTEKASECNRCGGDGTYWLCAEFGCDPEGDNCAEIPCTYHIKSVWADD